jgi:hypothetical protein
VRQNRAAIIAPGSLEHDREIAIVDAAGKPLNAKRTAAVHRLIATVDWLAMTVTFVERATAATVETSLHVVNSPHEWLSDFFGQSVSLQMQPSGGFPDDPVATGPTFISAATLAEVASWYPGMTADDAALRFRANIVIDGVPAFWEDRLYSEAGASRRFTVGDVAIDGTNPCQRCIVPTRDQITGEATDDFAQTFRQRREATLPAWAERSRFNHYYRLAVNTIIPPSEFGKVVQVGDEVQLIG